MGIVDFFKKFSFKEEVSESSKEEISFLEVEGWMKEKMNKEESKEKEVILKIKQHIEKFTEDIQSKIFELKKFDVLGVKADDQTKNIVLKSREKYIEFLEELLGELNHFEEEKLSKVVELVNRAFSNFTKKSAKNYDRATILIGKEIGSIKDSLKNFSRESLRIFEDKKEIISSEKKLFFVKEKLDEFNSTKKSLEEMELSKTKLNKKIELKEKEENTIREKLKDFKSSSTYLKYLENLKRKKSLLEDLKKEILEFKHLIDFKALTGFFHVFPKQMNILKDYQENFSLNFEKDSGKVILDLIDEAKLNSKEILKQVENIESLREKISVLEKNLGKDEAEKISYEIDRINFERNSLMTERDGLEKKMEKLNENLEKLQEVLKNSFLELGAVIVFPNI